MNKKVTIPPIKIQGIKTKLIPFISEHISLQPNTVWYEPFMGSGVVGFNLAPKDAIFSDNNPYIIDFYRQLQNKTITPAIVRQFLTTEGSKLAQTPANQDSYYYVVRKRFNQYHNPLDFLFLQRSNFNGMIRSGKNGYNVPFGRKPNRFAPALITKIVNQVRNTQDKILQNNWQFKCLSWQQALTNLPTNSFIYLDPPYIGRTTDYFQHWTEQDTNELSDYFKNKPELHYALSMWQKNKYRENPYLKEWTGNLYTTEHFYYLGGKEQNRNQIIEALIIN